MLRSLTCLTAIALSVASAQSGEEIMRKADKANRSRDERSVIEMKLIAKNGQEQERSLEVLGFTDQDGDDDKGLMRFMSPPKVRGTAVLTVERSGGADDQWVFLPALKKTKRIASGQRTNRFAGTDFTFEDLRSENFEEYQYKRLDDQKEGDRDCWVVEATAKPDVETGYSKRVIWVDKERLTSPRTEFYNSRGEKQKTLRQLDFSQDHGLWRSRGSIMEDHLRGTKTVWRTTERQINPGLDESTFTVATLERGA
ncbi:MAG: outer membrane lipoprotein-sorting protein [Planctomycetota bacterium]